MEPIPSTDFIAMVFLVVGFILGRRLPPIKDWKLPAGITGLIQGRSDSKGDDSSTWWFRKYRDAPVTSREPHHLEKLVRLGPSGRYYWICICTEDGKASSFDGAHEQYSQHEAEVYKTQS